MLKKKRERDFQNGCLGVLTLLRQQGQDLDNKRQVREMDSTEGTVVGADF